MKIFLDTANLDELEKGYEIGASSMVSPRILRSSLGEAIQSKNQIRKRFPGIE